MRATTIITSTLTLALACALPAEAGTGDYKAKRLLEKVIDAWDASDPEQNVAVLEEALGVPDVTETLVMQILLTKGRLILNKLGDPLRAEEDFDAIVAKVRTEDTLRKVGSLRRTLARAERDERVKEREASLKARLQEAELKLQLKGQAMVAKANICYAERGEVLRALRIYVGANYASPSATTCDVASQFCYRVSRSPDTDEALRLELLRRAHSFSLQSLALAPAEVSDEEEWKRHVQRYLLQLAIVQWARGAEHAARALSGLLDPSRLIPATLYQQAVLAAIEGRDDDATRLLGRFFQETRPTAGSRNDLRKFVRSEPDFQSLLKRADWEAFVEDEPVD